MTVTPEDRAKFPLARRWPRFFARIFDTWWEMMLISFGAGFILGRYSPAFLAWMNDPMGEFLFGFVCVPAALALDAVVHSLAGNTPGKFLLALTVKTPEGEALSFSQYIFRNLLIWPTGMALGIPVIAFLRC